MKFLTSFPNTVFQSFKDHPKAKGYAKVFAKYDEAEFRKLNKGGCGIYFTPNGFEGGRKIEFLTNINAVYADLDVAKEGDGTQDIADKKAVLLKGLLTDKLVPNFVIDTKNGLQPLWLVDEKSIDKEAQERYTRAVSGIIEWSKGFGCMGDKVKDITRVLRLPGYYHMKGSPYLCKVSKYTDQVYDLDIFLEAFPIEEEVEPIKEHKKGAVIREIEHIDFQDLIIRAFASVGRRAEFDKQSRLVLDGRLTGTFQGKKDDRNYLASTSHEPFEGNRITAVADILSCTNKEAFAWIKEEYGLNEQKLKKKEKVREILGSVDKKATKELKEYYTWGTDELTWSFAPIKRGTYSVLVGESGDGKTTYCYDMAIKNAQRGHKVLYISLEMDTKEILDNIARAYSGITIKEEITKTIPDNKQKAYERKLNELMNIENLVTKGVRRGMDINWDCVRELMSGEWDLIFIDNLDLIEGNEGESENQRQRNISKMAMGFTSEIQTPIIMLHHYRKRAKGAGKSRSLDDVGGSAKITHDADRVIQIYRNRGEDISAEEKAELKLHMRKARGYNESFKTVYFYKGSFYDEYKKADYSTLEWWQK